MEMLESKATKLFDGLNRSSDDGGLRARPANLTDGCSLMNLKQCDVGRYRFLKEWSEYTTWGTIPIALIGVAGNALILAIRLQPGMRSSVNLLLLALAMADLGTLLFCTASIIPELQEAKQRQKSVFSAYCKKYIAPLAVTFLTVSIYLLLLITIERCIAVCTPFRARRLCTRRNAVAGIVLVLLFSVAYNFPRFFEIAISYRTSIGNKTGVVYGVTVADQLYGPHYRRLYSMWGYVLVVFAAPFFLLTLLNLKIILSLRASGEIRRRISPSEKADHSTTVMLLLVIFVFLLCNSPVFAIKAFELQYFERRRVILATPSREWEQMFVEQIRLKPLNEFLASTATLCIVVSSGVNFPIYYKFSVSFRKGFWALMGKKDTPNHSDSSDRRRSVKKNSNSAAAERLLVAKVANGSSSTGFTPPTAV